MPRSQAQRRRSQLAASRDEVQSLQQKLLQLEAASVAAAQERAVTERLMLERLADADARCRNAELRAEVAEIKLLQCIESEQRTGLLKSEDSALGEVCAMFPEAVEVASRAELAAAEEAAWANLATAQADNRRAVKRRRNSLRKRKQKERKREQERRNRGEPAPQGDGSIGSPDEFATAHSVISTASDSASSTPVSSYNALFVDNICFWVAAFAPYSWAPVCNKTARTVFKVMHIYEQGWISIGMSIARFQSKGSHHTQDHERIGPEYGLPYEANLSVQALRNEVCQLMRSNPAAAPPGWASRFMLHMDLQCNMYENMRLQHKSLYIAVNDCVVSCRSAVENIGQALDAFDQREQAEDDDVEAADERANNSDASV